MASEVSRGALDGELAGVPRDVLIATAEDHFASVVWGRLKAAGADMDRVHRVHVEDHDGEGLLTLPDDVDAIARRCAELRATGRPVALVIADPVTAFFAASIDTHRDAAVRHVLAPLAMLAESEDLAGLGVAHLTKDQAGKLLNRVGGSVAFGAAPRSVLAFARHPDDPDAERGDQRVIVHAKSNHGRFAPALAVGIESVAIELDDHALERLADLLAPRVRDRIADDAPRPEPPIYTTRSLAAAVSVSPKVIRGAIERGDLAAEKQGGRYVTAREAVRAWGTAATNRREPRPPRRTRATSGRPLGDALDRLDVGQYSGQTANKRPGRRANAPGPDTGGMTPMPFDRTALDAPTTRHTGRRP